MAQKTVTVKFDGQTHQVELTTFTSVLLNYSAVLKAAADEVGIGDTIRISIDATEQGSLDVVLSVASEGLPGLIGLLNDNAGAIESVLGITGGIFAFKKWLSGKKKVDKIDDGEDETKIVTAGDQTMSITNSVFNLYANNKVTDKIDDTFQILEDNPSVSGFEIIEDGTTSFRAEREEFSAIADSPNYEGESTRHVCMHAFLLVIKPCFANSTSRKWKFLMDGNEMSAPIADVEFLNDLTSYSFTRGTKLDAELDVLQEYIPEYDGYVNRKYVVTKVNDVIPPVETLPLFDQG